MDWLTEELKSTIKKYADINRLSAVLVTSVIAAESNGDSCAVRFEPNFNHFYQVNKMALLNKISVETERTLQKMSIGLMQTMGCINRELFYTKNLMRFIDSELSIEYGCKKLAELSKKYKIETDIISAYNAGSVQSEGGPYRNEHYVSKVLAFKRQLRDQK